MTNSITLSSVKAIAELALNGEIFSRFIKNYTDENGGDKYDLITLTALHKDRGDVGLILSIKVEKIEGLEDKKTFDFLNYIQDALTSKGYKVYNGTVNLIKATYKVSISNIIDANNPPFLRNAPAQYERGVKLCTCYVNVDEGKEGVNEGVKGGTKKNAKVEKETPKE